MMETFKAAGLIVYFLLTLYGAWVLLVHAPRALARRARDAAEYTSADERYAAWLDERAASSLGDDERESEREAVKVMVDRDFEAAWVRLAFAADDLIAALLGRRSRDTSHQDS